MLNNSGGNKVDMKNLKLKKQKESHSEIERKRRERMKTETLFLRDQLSDRFFAASSGSGSRGKRKAKLSIYRAAADQLMSYTEKLGRRDYILSDSEYSAIVINNFSGFAIHIRCSDGVIVWCSERTRDILGFHNTELMCTSVYAIVEPLSAMQERVRLALLPAHSQSGVEQPAGLQSNARNFIATLQINPKVLLEHHHHDDDDEAAAAAAVAAAADDVIGLEHCICGSDNRLYRFVEFCGEIHEASGEFRALCRPLELANEMSARRPPVITKHVLSAPASPPPTHQHHYNINNNIINNSNSQSLHHHHHHAAVTQQHAQMEPEIPVEMEGSLEELLAPSIAEFKPRKHYKKEDEEEEREEREEEEQDDNDDNDDGNKEEFELDGKATTNKLGEIRGNGREQEELEEEDGGGGLRSIAHYFVEDSARSQFSDFLRMMEHSEEPIEMQAVMSAASHRPPPHHHESESQSEERHAEHLVHILIRPIRIVSKLLFVLCEFSLV